MGDTETFTLHEDELGEHPNSYNGWSKEYAVLAVRKAIEKAWGKNGKTLEFSNYSCTKLRENRIYSEVCYIETASLGFFFIMRDMVDHINVIYNRWD